MKRIHKIKAKIKKPEISVVEPHIGLMTPEQYTAATTSSAFWVPEGNVREYIERVDPDSFTVDYLVLQVLIGSTYFGIIDRAKNIVLKLHIEEPTFKMVTDNSTGKMSIEYTFNYDYVLYLNKQWQQSASTTPVTPPRYIKYHDNDTFKDIRIQALIDIATIINSNLSDVLKYRI